MHVHVAVLSNVKHRISTAHVGSIQMYTADGTALHGLDLNLKLPLRGVEGKGDHVPSMTVCLGARLSRVSVQSCFHAWLHADPILAGTSRCFIMRLFHLHNFYSTNLF